MVHVRYSCVYHNVPANVIHAVRIVPIIFFRVCNYITCLLLYNDIQRIVETELYFWEVNMLDLASTRKVELT